MNEQIHFFIKISSLTLYSWKGDVGCVWERSWRQWTDCYIDPSSLHDHSSTSSSSWLGLLNRGSLRAQVLCLELVLTPLASCLQLDSSRLRHLVILLSHAHLLLLFFRLFTQVHLLIDGSVEDHYITNGNFINWKVKGLHFRICNNLVPNLNPKYQEERTLEYMLQISPVQLKALLNVSCKVVNNTCTFLLGARLNLLSDCWWGTCCSTIFTSFMSFKVLDQLENLTPVWKCVEIELPSLCSLNNLLRLSFVICLHAKDLLHHLKLHLVNDIKM